MEQSIQYLIGTNYQLLNYNSIHLEQVTGLIKRCSDCTESIFQSKKEHVERWIEELKEFFVLIKSPYEIIGSVGWKYDEIEKAPFLDLLRVDPANQRKGLGRKLYQTIEQKVREFNPTRIITLPDFQDNGFYQKLGFEYAKDVLGNEILEKRFKK